jgi:hypothetical protein
MSPDPTVRVARRQNTVDRLTELLTEWGCPEPYVAGRVALILDVLERHGWTIRVDDAPALSGHGSTPEGRAAARRILANTRAGCTCGDDRISLAPDWHPAACPVRATTAPQDGATSPPQ